MNTLAVLCVWLAGDPINFLVCSLAVLWVTIVTVSKIAKEN